MTVADLKERLKNTFLTLDYYGKEEVYGGKRFPAGTVALDVLNISEETVERILELTDPMMHFVDQLYLGKVDLLLMEKSRKNVFEVVDVLGFSKADIKKAQALQKANITVRNFPESVQQLRKRLKLADGGDCYMFATTLADERKLLVICKKEK